MNNILIQICKVKNSYDCPFAYQFISNNILTYINPMAEMTVLQHNKKKQTAVGITGDGYIIFKKIDDTIYLDILTSQNTTHFNTTEIAKIISYTLPCSGVMLNITERILSGAF